MSLDRRIRSSQDPVEDLVWRLRQGEVTEDQVRLAAALGDPRAIAIVGKVKSPPFRQYVDRVDLLEKVFEGSAAGVAHFACSVVYRSIFSWFGDKCDESQYPVGALESAMHFLEGKGGRLQLINDMEGLFSDLELPVLSRKCRGAISASLYAARAAYYARIGKGFPCEDAASATFELTDSGINPKKGEEAKLKKYLALYVLGDIVPPRRPAKKKRAKKKAKNPFQNMVHLDVSDVYVPRHLLR